MSHFQTTCYLLILFFLLAVSGFFSASETALMALNRYRLRHRARIKKRYALLLLDLLKRPDRLLGAILIGNTTANVLASSLATILALHFWGEKSVLIVAIILTIVILIFSEIAPKTLAAIYPDQVSKWIALPIKIILKLFHPLVLSANLVTNGLLRLFRIPVTNYTMEPLSREELRSVVYDTTGKISRQYQTMLLGILDLNKLAVDDVMIPSHEIKGIDIEQSFESMLFDLSRLHQDWIPFYRDNINQVVGVLYAHDVYKLLRAPQNVSKEILMEMLEEPYFVPEGTPVNIQLAYFQQNHDTVAFVVDEYGEIQGLLTLHEILDEIIGGFDNVTNRKRIQLQASGDYLVDGGISVREFNRVSEWELPLRGPRTINGLIVEYLEALPHKGTAVLIAGYPIEIMQVKNNRVKLARIFPRLPDKT